jgi:hypothetical protein
MLGKFTQDYPIKHGQIRPNGNSLTSEVCFARLAQASGLGSARALAIATFSDRRFGGFARST